MGREKPLQGAVYLGEHNIVPNYFEQVSGCVGGWRGKAVAFWQGGQQAVHREVALQPLLLKAWVGRDVCTHGLSFVCICHFVWPRMFAIQAFCCGYLATKGCASCFPPLPLQNQAEALDLELSVIDTLVQAAPDAKLADLKALLGRMLFSGTAVDKKVGGRRFWLMQGSAIDASGMLISHPATGPCGGVPEAGSAHSKKHKLICDAYMLHACMQVKVLSGGEKARLALAKFMCTKGTLLILDGEGRV
jgi:hypothetical protein